MTTLPYKYSTGWFGYPHISGVMYARWTLVHAIHFPSGKPICGSKLGPRMEFQWCSWGIKMEYIECKRCCKKAEEILNEVDKVRKRDRFGVINC